MSNTSVKNPPVTRRVLRVQGVPGWRDPRWGQVVALTTFCVLGQTALHFAITPGEVVLSAGTCMVADVLLAALRRHQVIVPLSGLISGLGLALLLRSPHPAVFVVAGVAAIGSKHLITRHGGRHVFNPSNFGLVVALAFTTQADLAMLTPGQWGRSTLIFFAIVCAGALVVFRAERLVLVAMFLACQMGAYAAVHGSLRPSVSLSGAVLTFAFFMITDPKTAPATWRGQALYSATIAIAGQLITGLGSMAGPFVALFLVCALMPLVEKASAWPVGRRLVRSGPAAGAH